MNNIFGSCVLSTTPLLDSNIIEALSHNKDTLVFVTIGVSILLVTGIAAILSPTFSGSISIRLLNLLEFKLERK